MTPQKVRVSCQMRPQNGDCLLVPSHEDVGNTFFEFVEGSAVRVEPFGLFDVREAFRGLARAAERCTHPKIDPSRSGREGYRPLVQFDRAIQCAGSAVLLELSGKSVPIAQR